MLTNLSDFVIGTLYIKQSCMNTCYNGNHYTVPINQSEVTVMQSDDNQPSQDNESSLVEHTNGLYVCDGCSIHT